jgi:uncharacterized protein (DUF2235 family)
MHPAKEALMKRLVICADGTWNTRDQMNDQRGKRRPTNVTKVARGVKPRDRNGIDQVVFYHDGLGTGDGVDKVTGGAFGSGIEDNIRVLYRFLIYNWEPNDEIYMFGFSRGAFTVRTLAGFMNLVGLVDKDGDYFVPDLYKCYENKSKKDSEDWRYAFRHIDNPRACPPIRFMGVWDTVGSLGAPGLLGWFLNSGKYEYHNVGITPEMHHCYHAMAIDERRKPFKPTLWTRPDGWNGTLEPAWFCGAHTNVGGSCAWDGLANEALLWMVEKAEDLGLEFDRNYLEPFVPCFNGDLYDSMGLKYKALGEYTRPLGEHKADGEMLHQSVLDRHAHAASKYQPENLMKYLAMGAPRVTNTTRTPRGTPCAPMAKP